MGRSHQRYDRCIQGCQERYKNHLKLCLICKNYELLQDFVYYLVECGQKATVLSKDMESNCFYVCEM